MFQCSEMFRAKSPQSDKSLPMTGALLLGLVAAVGYWIAFATECGAAAILVAIPCLCALGRSRTDRQAFYGGVAVGVLAVLTLLGVSNLPNRSGESPAAPEPKKTIAISATPLAAGALNGPCTEIAKRLRRLVKPVELRDLPGSCNGRAINKQAGERVAGNPICRRNRSQSRHHAFAAHVRSIYRGDSAGGTGRTLLLRYLLVPLGNVRKDL